VAELLKPSRPKFISITAANLVGKVWDIQAPN
jgi:hypothetical protein